MEWPSWLRFRLPALKQMSANSALDSLLYAWLACLPISLTSALFTDKTLLHFCLFIWGILTVALIGAFFYFALKDPDRLAPPSHQRYMARLLADERRSIGATIEGVVTSNPAAEQGKALTHGE